MIDLKYAELRVNGAEAHPVSSIRASLSGMIKRTFDVVAAFLGLILLSPLFVIVGVLIKRDSPGPVLYRGPRVGRRGQLFQILKFRTMYERPESYEGPRLTSREDSRITPLGHWLRNTKINELPQLWNVLIGEMSLVGPRPEDPEIVDSYPRPVREEILSVRPGVTSPASVLYHSEQDLLSNTNLMGVYLKEILPDKQRLDQLYVRHRSFASDLDIIFWTLTIFIPRIASMKIPEGYLFAGPLSRFIHRHVSWFTLDVIVAFAAVSAATLVWRIQGPINWGWGYLALLALCLAVIFSAVNYLGGLNNIIWSRAGADNAIGLFLSAGSVTLLALLINHVQNTYHWLPLPALPFELVLFIGLLAQCGFIFIRYRLRLLAWIPQGWSTWRQDIPGLGERVLILGDGDACEIADWLLHRSMFCHVFSTVGIVATEDPTKQGMRLNSSEVLGGLGDLAALIRKHDVRMIVYTAAGTLSKVHNAVLNICESSGVKLVFLDDLLGLLRWLQDRPSAAREYIEQLQQPADSGPLYDTLTGLPNRALLQERVRQSLASANYYNTIPALILIRLNGRDTFGAAHEPGIEEELLKTTAKRLAAYKREGDTLARFKTYEFALLLENLPHENAAKTIIKRTRALMAKPFLIGKNRFLINAHVGLYLPSDDLEEMQELRYRDLGTYFSQWKSLQTPLLKARRGNLNRIIGERV